MSKEIYISSTPHETRLAIVENDDLTEIYYERENEYTLAGSIYNGRVTRVLPGMQSSFVDIGLDRDAFLYITDFMEEAGDSADFDTNGDRPQARRRGSSPEATQEEPGVRQGRRNDRRRGNRERRGSWEKPQEGETREAGQETNQETNREEGFADLEQESNFGASSEDAAFSGAQDNSQIDEGAPQTESGADGSRRWRGRRGRRRGRSGQRELSPQTSEPQADSTEVHSEQELSDEAPFDLEAGAEDSAPAADTAENIDRHQRGERRERNERNDRRDGRDRNNRRRVPRGFAPRTSLYGVDEAGEAQQDAPAEPIILPGESLSKYRGNGDKAQTEASASAPKASEPTIALPSNPGFVVPAGWDGGDVLPGETLSRHRHSAKQPAPRPVVPAESASEPKQAAPTTVEAAAEPEAPVAPAEFAAEPVEYEPVEASASYRVDPAPPSEFRQAAPLVEEEKPAPQEQEHEVPAHEFTSIHATGEMTEEPAAAFVPEAATEPASPLEHETVIINPAENVIEGVPVPPPQHFAPGAGELEEEVIEDEEYAPALQASSTEEAEEETLEGAADLGTMIREMSIDEITGSGSTADSDEDDDLDELEEEDAFDDGVHSDVHEYEADLEEHDEAEEEEDHIHEDSSHDDIDEDSAEEGEPAAAVAPGYQRPRDSDRSRGRRDGRRGRSRFNGGSGSREGRRGRSSMQTTDLPAINDLLKPGQEVLVQIAKEPIAKKGARITSHIALPGRFLVFMPTVNHTGVSRKIESDAERRRLKDILLSEKGEASGGFIVRTAAAGASEEELRSDLRFLLNLWADIKQRSDSSKSPALIYHDLNLVERILRDQVTDNFSAIWVDTESDYERILRFLQRFQPSLIRRVKLYTKETPLFEQFGITEEINKALRSKVWLKSGGSIVINQTEALVAIDINTGKFVGKTARLEDTIVKTNLDAIPEIVRQIRLRDLGGIIIIDFIDMDERKNRNKVMAALEEELKKDRAPSKVLQFNDFGLVAITRKRVKQSLERTLSTTCSVCQGTGMTKSPVTVCNDIYIEMRKMQRHLDRGDVMLRVHPDVVKQLKSSTKWLQEMEEMVGKTILIKSDPSLHPEQFDIH